MLDSSNTSLVSKCFWRHRHLCARQLAERPILQNSRLYCVNQQLAHAHDFALTAAERMLSSRPAVTVQSVTSKHLIPSRCRFPVNVITSPVTIEVSLDTVQHACSRHESCQVSQTLDVSHRFDQLFPRHLARIPESLA